MPPPLSNSTTLKRIHREVADLKKEDLGTISLAPSDDNLFHWTATIPGPEGSCYEGGIFQVDINLAHDYPFSAPKVTFRTRIYHMNINERGNICIDILKHNWSPALSLFKVILSLSSLLTDPNPRDPLVPSIATEYVRNRSQHDRTARNWTELYARPPPPAPAPTASKGKAKVIDTTTSHPSASRRSTSSGTIGNVHTQVITIDDSDEDAPATGARGHRTQGPRTGVKRKRTQTSADSSPSELLIEDDEIVERPTRRRRSGDLARGGGGSGTGGSGRRRPPRVDDDVIVIED